MSDVEQLRKQVDEQALTVRQLKSSKADKEQVTEQVALLLALKEKLRIAGGDNSNSSSGTPAAATPKASGGNSEAGKSAGFTLKTAKGTKDYTAKEMAVRKEIFATLTEVFENHGAVTIDTPVFELKEILMGKYGEDSKLIYDLKDQGGEECSLRYDLTVPFARHVAMNGITNIKRYQIAKVYRRDQPAMTKGRMREFYQCDYDIAGAYDAMIPDAECVRVTVEVLTRVDVGPFVVKINHRKILDAIFDVAGVPEEKVRMISSAVDKLDKLPWADVRREMVEDKGLDGAVADRIGEYVQLRGGAELLDKLEAMPELMASEKAREGVQDMRLFFRYAAIFNVVDYVSLDMSLARGLDYYTGIIYEAVLVEENVRPTQAQPTATGAKEVKEGGDIDESQVRVGSIAAGGRYDKLVGMFSASRRTKGKGKAADVPCVGISFGIERIFSVVYSRMQSAEVKANRTKVYVISLRDGLLEERLRIATELWDCGIATEFAYKVKPRFQNQLNTCDSEVIPWAVLIGSEEVEQGLVKLKSMAKDVSAEEKSGVAVKREDMVAELKKRLGIMQ
ncbi:histidyl-tRNA synthetase [Kickxella alabastrina]|uniref:histidyl-tRNA synthetase n=1 Tax=Kickxella alabastrina TaxID=61397 RepID=UPI00221EE4C7|nr:histidyl-tRNA synthetase [Kickxella alabastrina]KAI7832901.1 histidyl-tRNA synthetase [Kickxella alabastrina]KAJ1945796.1 Cytoplasmic and mitochondrial histidine tRNA synthetase [Kickxella alabastrina]